MSRKSTLILLSAIVIVPLSVLAIFTHGSLQLNLDEKKEVRNTVMISNVVKYTRIYSDTEGESHFEDLTIDLNEIDFAPPAPPIFTSDLNPSSDYGFASVLPGWESEWHPAPKRQFMIYLSGTIEAEVSDGEIRQFGPGSITLVEDTTGKGHKSRVIGSEKVVTVVIQLED